MKIKIEEIIIGSRARSDMGNLQELADSIKENGLLQPIAVDVEGFLIDGQRRIEAVKLLGWTEIEAHRLTVNDLLKAEFDANEMRKSFTPSERVALAERVEEWVKAKARNKINEAGKYGSLGGRGNKNPHVELGTGVSDKQFQFKSRDVIARMAGTSPETLKKAKEVVNAAKENPENNDLVEKMDQTGKVDPAFKKLKERKGEITYIPRDSQYDKRKAEHEQQVASGIYLVNELTEIAKQTGSKITSLIVKMPDGRQKKMGSISQDWYKNRNILNWIIENVGLGTEEKDIIIHREGNQVFVFDSDHVDKLRNAIRYLMDRYSFTGSLMRELTEEEKECQAKNPMTL